MRSVQLRADISNQLKSYINLTKTLSNDIWLYFSCWMLCIGKLHTELILILVYIPKMLYLKGQSPRWILTFLNISFLSSIFGSTFLTVTNIFSQELKQRKLGWRDRVHNCSTSINLDTWVCFSIFYHYFQKCWRIIGFFSWRSFSISSSNYSSFISKVETNFGRHWGPQKAVYTLWPAIIV